MTEERDESMPGAEPETPETVPGDAGPADGDVSVPAEPEAPASPTGDRCPGETDAAGEISEALPLLEALLFAASKPVAIEKLAEASELPEASVAAALEALEASCAGEGRGGRLDRVGGGGCFGRRRECD